jgi:hypothetical protein
MDEKIKKEKPKWHKFGVKISVHLYPAFIWSYGPGKEMWGMIQASLFENTLVLWTRRSRTLQYEEQIKYPINASRNSRIFYFDQPYQILVLTSILKNVYGWGKPPHFDDVLSDFIKMNKMLQKIFLDLEEKWERIIT